MAENLYFPAYFKDWGAIRGAVTPEQGWKLFNLCLDYAAGNAPEPGSDPVVIAFFTLLSGGIDRSIAKSEQNAQKKRYARYCGICKENREEPLPFEKWVTDVDMCQQVSTDVDNHNHNHNQKSKSESESQSDIKVDNPPHTHFVPPTVEEVAAYCQERGNSIDPHLFVDYYTTVDWYRGQTKITDWEACVRTWERKEREKNTENRSDTNNVFLQMYEEERGQ